MAIYAKNTLRSLPSTFTMFQGGLYIGNFYPGPPVNSTSSDLFGNKNTGVAKTYKSDANGPGDKSFAWGIVIAGQDYNPPVNSSFSTQSGYVPFIPNSQYDGYHNSLENTIFYDYMRSKAKYYGYTDWYVPSIDELGFILNELPAGYYIPKAFNCFESYLYRSSTLYTKDSSPENNNKEKSFFYGQVFDKTKYGATVLFPATSSFTKIRLIRRIALIHD